MQHLLDFIQEHTLEEQLYLVAACPSGEVELIWRRDENPDHWQVCPKHCEGPAELVHRRCVVDDLLARGADEAALKGELHAMLAAQIAYADLILRDANEQLGNELVQRFVFGHRAFIEQLQAAAEAALGTRPRMQIVSGGSAQTQLRTGHLSLVR